MGRWIAYYDPPKTESSAVTLQPLTTARHQSASPLAERDLREMQRPIPEFACPIGPARRKPARSANGKHGRRDDRQRSDDDVRDRG